MNNTDNTDLSALLVKEILSDRKKDRTWRNVRWFSTVAVALSYAFVLSGPAKTDVNIDTATEPYAALVRLDGEIGPGAQTSAEKVNSALTKAFDDKGAKGVVLLVNSPGGTPVQATLIHHHIERMRAEHPNKKIMVVGEDYVASGAYLLAVAANKIYVSDATVTGSVGVISSGFGFDKAMSKFGIERRNFHAGAHKGRNDPYVASTENDKAKMQRTLDTMHRQFIQIVKEGRKGKLKGDPKELFSGDFWTGEEAVQLGLADGIGDVPTVIRAEFGATAVKEYSGTVPLWEKLTKDFTASVEVNVQEMALTKIKAVVPTLW